MRKLAWAYVLWTRRRAIVEGVERGKQRRRPRNVAIFSAMMKEFFIEPIRDELNRPNLLFGQQWNIPIMKGPDGVEREDQEPVVRPVPTARERGVRLLIRSWKTFRSAYGSGRSAWREGGRSA